MRKCAHKDITIGGSNVFHFHTIYGKNVFVLSNELAPPPPPAVWEIHDPPLITNNNQSQRSM